MAEYIEREAALEAVWQILNGMGYSEKHNDRLVEEVDAILDNIPAADVRPVVLCRDCKHRDPEDHKCDSGEMERQGCPFKVADDYFCAYGEKREES